MRTRRAVVSAELLRSLIKHATFLIHGRQRKCLVFLFNLSLYHHIYILKSLFSSRDDLLENLAETTVLACEMFTSGCRPWLKNLACLSSLLGPVSTAVYFVFDIYSPIGACVVANSYFVFSRCKRTLQRKRNFFDNWSVCLFSLFIFSS